MLYIRYLLFIIAIFTFNYSPGEMSDHSTTAVNYKNWPALKGDYLGQKPPGMVSVIFAPDIISTDQHESNLVFTPDRNEMYFTNWAKETGTKILFSRKTDGQWEALALASFSKNYGDVDVSFSYDGKRVFFGTRRPRPGETETRKKGFDIWFADRNKTGWSNEQYLGPVVNSGNHQVYPSVARNGTLYFQAKRKQGYGKADIYRSKLIDGVYQTPENLGSAINSENYEGDVFIAHDQSYLIVSISGREDSFGDADLYISFAQSNGSWSSLKNMGSAVNSNKREFCPSVTHDGKYLFFTTNRFGNGDIFWIDAEIIEDLKPKSH